MTDTGGPIKFVPGYLQIIDFIQRDEIRQQVIPVLVEGTGSADIADMISHDFPIAAHDKIRVIQLRGGEHTGKKLRGVPVVAVDKSHIGPCGGCSLQPGGKDDHL